MAALGADRERREQRLAARQRLVYGPHRRVAAAVMVGAGADEGEHRGPVSDRDRAIAELLEQLVGDRARGARGEAAPQLRKRRVEQLERRRRPARSADARHQPESTSTTPGMDVMRGPSPSASPHNGDSPGRWISTASTPTRRAPASSSFAPSPTKTASRGSTPSAS